jgi:hypothetical protein
MWIAGTKNVRTLAPGETLGTCSVAAVESDPVIMCNRGSTFIRWHVKKDGQPTGIFFDTTEQSTSYTPVGTVTIGACLLDLIVIGGAATIAGATRALTPAFIGAPSNFTTATVPGILHSITVSARGVTDGFIGLTTNQVTVATPSGTSINLMSGETRTFSVERSMDGLLNREYVVDAFGGAYANITYTYI